METARARQFFIVYRGSNPKISNHVVVGIVNNGTQMIYDPQNGAKYFDPKEFGPFTAWPVRFNGTSK